MTSSNSAFHDLLSSPHTLKFNFFLKLRVSDTAPTFSGAAASHVAWLNDCTEIIGSESGDHFTAEEPEPVPVVLPRRYSTAAGKSRPSYSASTVICSDGLDFPPKFLSTLNPHGRPIFVLKKTRIPAGDGFRLLITMERDGRFFSSSDVTLIENEKKIESPNSS